MYRRTLFFFIYFLVVTMSDTADKKIDTKRGKFYMSFIVLGVVIAAIVYGMLHRQQTVGSVLPREGGELRSASFQPLTSSTSDIAILASDYPASALTVISNFEEGEGGGKWQGGGVFDEEGAYEGNRSLSLVSVNGAAVEEYLKKDLNLSQSEFIEFMLHISDPEGAESFFLRFGDMDMKNYYQYSFSNVKAGWNLIQIPKRQFVAFTEVNADFGWEKVQKTLFSLQSRPDNVLIAQIDMLRAVSRENLFEKDWNVSGNGLEKRVLSLVRRENGEQKFLIRNFGSAVAVLSDLKRAEHMTMSASISPQSSGRSGLFVRGNYNTGYGYYFLIDGVQRNGWQIIKLDSRGWSRPEEVVRGDIGNTIFTSDKEYWLRVDAEGTMLSFFISFDNQEYFVLGKIKDGEFRSGDAGLTVLDGGWSVFDHVLVKKL